MTENGFLTSVDKDFLQGEKTYGSKQGRYDRRRAIRERTRAALSDFAFLCDELEADERAKIFPDNMRTSEGREFQKDLINTIQFLYIGMGGSTGFSRPLKWGVANGEARIGTVRSPFDLAVRFTIDPVWNADIETVTDLVEADDWDRLELPDLPLFISVAKRADAIDFDEIRGQLTLEEWFKEYRIGKKSRAIPGGHSTPLMDPKVFEREGIGEMSAEELKELFGEGYPSGSLTSPIYDGKKVFRPPPIGSDGEIEIIEWIDEADENDDEMPTEGGEE